MGSSETEDPGVDICMEITPSMVGLVHLELRNGIMFGLFIIGRSPSNKTRMLPVVE